MAPNGRGEQRTCDEIAPSADCAARTKCHLAQIMHQNLPRRAAKCVVSAQSARSRALPARSRPRTGTPFRKSTCAGDIAKKRAHRIGHLTRRRRDRRRPQTGRAEVLAASPVSSRPSARCTLNIRSMNMHLMRNEHREQWMAGHMVTKCRSPTRANSISSRRLTCSRVGASGSSLFVAELARAQATLDGP